MSSFIIDSHSKFSSLPPTVKRQRRRSPSPASKLNENSSKKRLRSYSPNFSSLSHSINYSSRLLNFSQPENFSSSDFRFPGDSTKVKKSPLKQENKRKLSQNSTLSLLDSAAPRRSKRKIISQKVFHRFADPPSTDKFSFPTDGISGTITGHRRKSFCPSESFSLNSACLRGSNTLTDKILPRPSEFSLRSQFSLSEISQIDERTMATMSCGHELIDQEFKRSI